MNTFLSSNHDSHISVISQVFKDFESVEPAVLHTCNCGFSIIFKYQLGVSDSIWQQYSIQCWIVEL